MNPIDLHKDKLMGLCNTHKVQELYMFGSVLSDKLNDSSDIDKMIQFQQMDILDCFDN
ncbi:MAG: hypothetical protein NTZ48_05875 [Candidatus Omnitrophica bacterium]|nr:hypothetical protein [Candidatus Omnitrophota bacterium]